MANSSIAELSREILAEYSDFDNLLDVLHKSEKLAYFVSSPFRQIMRY